MTKSSRLSYFISAGEYSGDLLASDLVLQLKQRLPTYQAYGLVGESMRHAGVKEVCAQERFAVMGILDVVRKLADLKQAEAYILSKIDDIKPAFAILVDFPGLHFRLAEQLKLRGIPVYQYCAPKVWAWGEKRVALLRRDFALVLGILPFETEFFKKHDVPYHYVGSPHIDRVSQIMVEKTNFGFSNGDKIVGLLPGSRVSELKLIFPHLLQIKAFMNKAQPDLRFAMPLARNLSLDDLCAALPNPERIKQLSETRYQYDGIEIFHGMSLELMAVSDVAIVASGTATLECGLVGTPMVVVYVMDENTFEIAKAKVKVPWASLVNIIANRAVITEYLQHFDNEDVALEVLSLLEPGAKRSSALAELQNLREGLEGGAAATAARAIVQDLVKKRVVSDG